MKEENAKTEIKKGRGCKSNSSDWQAAYNSEYDKYVAKLHFSSAAGVWTSFYEIPKETYDLLGTIEDDDYKSEDLIKEGRRLYRYENERNYIEPVKITYDRNYKKLCRMLLD